MNINDINEGKDNITVIKDDIMDIKHNCLRHDEDATKLNHYQSMINLLSSSSMISRGVRRAEHVSIQRFA